MAKSNNASIDITNDIIEISIGQLPTILQLHAMRAKDNSEIMPPVMLHSTPGVGKTQSIREWAEKAVNPITKKVGRKLHTWILAIKDPTDVKGVPFPDRENKVTEWFIAQFLKDIQPGDVIFADELSRAPELVRAAFLTLFQDRKLGSFVMPDCVDIISAMNDQDVGVMRLSSAMNNRFTHYYLTVDAASWVNEYATMSNIHPVVQAYINKAPGNLSDFSRDRAAFPSPRSVENVSRLLIRHDMLMKEAKTDKEKEELKAVLPATLAGTVGKGVATEITAYIKEIETAKELDFKKILSSPKSADIPKRSDLIYACICGLSYLADKTNLDAIYDYTKRLKPEMMVACFRMISSRKPELGNEKAFIKLSVEHGDIVSG